MHSARALPLPGRVVLGTTACSLRASHHDWRGRAASLLPGTLLRRQGHRYTRTAAGVKRRLPSVTAALRRPAGLLWWLRARLHTRGRRPGRSAAPAWRHAVRLRAASK